MTTYLNEDFEGDISAWLAANGGTTQDAVVFKHGLKSGKATGGLVSTDGLMENPIWMTQRIVITGYLTNEKFKITFNGQQTGNIERGVNESAAGVQAALEALSNIAPGDISVTSFSSGSTFTYDVTFLETGNWNHESPPDGNTGGRFTIQSTQVTSVVYQGRGFTSINQSLYFRIHTVTNPSNPHDFRTSITSATTPHSFQGVRLVSGVLTAFIARTGFPVTLAASGFTPSLDTWYVLDVQCVLSGTTMTVTWAIDGNPQTGLSATTSLNEATIAVPQPPEVFWPGELNIDDWFIESPPANYPVGEHGQDKLAFTNIPTVEQVNTSSSVLTVQRQNDDSSPAAEFEDEDLTVALDTDSGTGVFRNEADDATITEVTIPAGESDARFRYKDSVAGEYTITASEDPDGGLTDAVQLTTVIVDINPFASGTTLECDDSTSQNNDGATKQAGEPNHAGEPGGASVWFTFSVENLTDVNLSVTSGDFDPVVAVYTGSAVNALSIPSSLDRTFVDSLTFVAVPDVEYHIAVDGVDGDTGDFTITTVCSPAQVQQRPQATYYQLLTGGDV